MKLYILNRQRAAPNVQTTLFAVTGWLFFLSELFVPAVGATSSVDNALCSSRQSAYCHRCQRRGSVLHRLLCRLRLPV